MVVPCQVWVERWSLVNSWRSESRESMVFLVLSVVGGLVVRAGGVGV